MGVADRRAAADPLRMKLPARLALAGAALTLALVPAALAASGNHPTVALNATAQSQAKAIGLVLNDLGGSGWTGGPVKADPGSSAPGCANFDPKQSDLEVDGAYESTFKHSSGLTFDASIEVFASSQMVALDWTRTAASPLLIGCLKQLLQQSNPSFVSVARRAVPRVGDATAMYRIVETDSSHVKQAVDVIVVAKGKTEITLTTTEPLAQSTVVQAAELRLVARLAQRDRG
jgi:hypothetical protein